MTIRLTIADLYTVMRQLNPSPDGFVPMKDFTEKSAETFKCTPLTVRNFVTRNNEYFEQKHGFIREKIPETINEQESDQKVYTDWKTQRERVLEECLKFLGTQTPSPIMDNILVLCASARDELSKYTDNRLQELLLMLKKEYDFTPTTL